MTAAVGSTLCFGVDSQPREQTFRATHLWQDLVVNFRLSMPRGKHRLKMRWFDECFTGKEGVEWLHSYLRKTGKFGTVSKTQAIKLLRKFLTSDVIEEVRGKLDYFDEDSAYLYKFVTEPGPFNFIEDPLSSLSSAEKHEGDKMDTTPATYNVACFTNEYAFIRREDHRNEIMIRGASPTMSSSDDKHLAARDMNAPEVDRLSAAQIATTWKEVTLSRLLRLVELPSLDSVLEHDAVDGKMIQTNALSSGRGLLNKAAALFWRSVRKPHSLPVITAPSTHHHTQRFSTKIKSDSQSLTESVTDVPQWVVLAMKCLTKWPDGCTEELVGGMPVYYGLELDVLQSLVQFFRELADPLISTKLFNLFMAVNNVLAEGKASVTNALQLCTLLLPQTNRTRLHRVLRFLHKTSGNHQLVLCKGRQNRDELLIHFTSVVLRSSSKISRIDQVEKHRVEGLVTFMVQNYQQIFKVPEDLKKEVQKRLDAIAAGKEDYVPSVGMACCSRITPQDYQREGVSASKAALMDLLDTILRDQSMSNKERKHRLREFQQAYPELYAQRLSLDAPSPGVGGHSSNLQRQSSLNLGNGPLALIQDKCTSSEALSTTILH